MPSVNTTTTDLGGNVSSSTPIQEEATTAMTDSNGQRRSSTSSGGSPSSSSPPRPPYSPITPVQTFASLANTNNTTSNNPPSSSSTTAAIPSSSSTTSQPQEINIDPGAPGLISEGADDNNTDAIALRAALSILQMQRQQAQRDIRALERVRGEARGDVLGFVGALKAGRLSSSVPRAGGLDGFDDDFDDDDEMEDDGGQDGEGGSRRGMGMGVGRFGPLPTAQNVVRMPPVNWAKYHVVGEALDKLHEEQRRVPPGGSGVGREHAVLAPYDPFADRTDPAAVRRGSGGGGVGKKG